MANASPVSPESEPRGGVIGTRSEARETETVTIGETGNDAFQLAAEDLLTAIDDVLDHERAKQA